MNIIEKHISCRENIYSQQMKYLQKSTPVIITQQAVTAARVKNVEAVARTETKRVPAAQPMHVSAKTRVTLDGLHKSQRGMGAAAR